MRVLNTKLLSFVIASNIVMVEDCIGDFLRAVIVMMCP